MNYVTTYLPKKHKMRIVSLLIVQIISPPPHKKKKKKFPGFFPPNVRGVRYNYCCARII